MGSGLANIALIRFNPVVSAMIMAESFKHWLIDANNTQWVATSALSKVRFAAYAVHFGSFLLAGVLFDATPRAIKPKMG